MGGLWYECRCCSPTRLQGLGRIIRPSQRRLKMWEPHAFGWLAHDLRRQESPGLPTRMCTYKVLFQEILCGIPVYRIPDTRPHPNGPKWSKTTVSCEMISYDSQST